jgi:type I restriction-modification system DNA methylase subunit
VIFLKDLANNNPNLTIRELNYAVQKTIDRIIFLRIGEDRGIEQYGRLMAIQNRSNVYKNLCELFREADQKYNSGLFHFSSEKGNDESPDKLTINLNISDNTLKEIIKNIYYPNSPYEFSVLPADILGHVYEQFLGKVIRLSEQHHAIIEDKPEVKKAGGVYYTPTYVVDYIVKNTVDELVKDKTPKQVEKIRILDPACGSGAFLLQAYQHLLDWHRDYYVGNIVDKYYKGKNPIIYQINNEDWRLTTAEKRRILLNNIFGVDIDNQAVEVTKLSLLLKVLEGENQETLQKQLKLFHERALPELGKNIKCGNSLIASDFYLSNQISLFDEEQKYHLNTFDWKTEFSEIFEGGGFDVVIGNPPWGAELDEYQLEYLRKKNSEIIVRMIDTFMYFVYQSLLKLNTSGYFGMILPDVVLYQKDNEKLRKIILDNFSLNMAVNVGNVFKKVNRPSAILIISKFKKKSLTTKLADLTLFKKDDKEKSLFEKNNYFESKTSNFSKVPGTLFTLSTVLGGDIWEKVNKVPHTLLIDLVDEDRIQRGVSPDFKEAFVVKTETIEKFKLEKERLKPVVTGGKEVKRYHILSNGFWLIYGVDENNIKYFPNIKKYIDSYKEKITCKEVKLNKHSLYSLHRKRKESIFLKDKKIVGVITSDKIVVSSDLNNFYATDGLFVFSLKDKQWTECLLGILNSKLLIYIYRLISSEKGRLLAQVKPTLIETIPIPIFKEHEEKCSQISRCVSNMEVSYQKISKAFDQEKIVIERQIMAFESEIDKLVYDIYNLNQAEIKIIEEAS